ncbi:oligopeptide transport system substrate-binding protein [Aliiroseovarius sediminilitoris]|uniref:Oligopeptide transport system substrate-binding protein n=1 Tax=Aliiroseovarius sediminilitoris TaxID=1173584 RepID=A0A1I0NCU2_9RHOB|nr:peptide ABC transporter substrate-binding protein [Aliiroseovarius sediminilitoris]SEV99208.1 oligopeptide transport system substrate-binding protein [Aliiroseovarius sediminilitoris]
MNISIKAALLCSAFAIASPALAAGTHPVTGEALADNQTYTYRMLDDVKSFDPQINTDVEGSHILRDLFEGLVNSDPQGNSVPGAAESWEVSEDGLTYTFKLRDAKWSNGDPVTAGDFVYAWRRLADPATASEYAWYMELMGVENATKIVAGEMAPDTLGVTALDDKTLEVKIDAPRPYFPGMLTHASTFPVNQSVLEAHGNEWTKPGNLVGNGAYVLTDYVPGVKVTRERNPMYWDNDNTILDTVVALVINDENIALTRYDAGEVDKTEVPAGQYPALKEKLPDETYSTPRSCSYIYMFNLRENGPEALKDVRVRKALSYALNRDVIVDSILKGGQYPSYNWTHQKTAGFEMPNIDYATWTQDERMAKAKELLEEAGYGPGGKPLELTLNYNTSEAHKKIAIAATQMWKQTLGANITLANFEWKVHLDKLRNGDFGMARYAWCGDYNEPSTYTDLFTSTSGHNNGKYNNPEYDALAKAAKTSANPAEEYKQMEQLLADDMPIVPVYQYTNVIMVKPDLKGFPFDDLMNNIYSRTMYKVAE